MEYKKASDKTYVKDDGEKFKCGVRLDGDKTCSEYEARFEAGVEPFEEGTALGATAQAHVYQCSREKGDSKFESRYLGADVGVSVSLNAENRKKENALLGGEVKARATLLECKAGPIHTHSGVGVSTALKVQDNTLEAKVVGCGFKFGKKLGFSVFDNEISVDLGYLFRKALPQDN